MKDQFTTHEIAKAMKKLGFNERCLTLYDKSAELGMIPEYCANEYFYKNESCAAPLWQQAIDWLREERKILVECGRGTSGKYYAKIVNDFSKTYVGSGNFSFYTNEAILNNGLSGFNNHFEARESAILKALEIVSDNDLTT